MAEKPGVRRTMERMTRKLIENGAPPAEARRQSRAAARRYDQRVSDGRQRNPVSHGDTLK